MKKLIFSIVAASTVLLSACNSNGKEHKAHDSENTGKDSTGHVAAKDDKEVKQVTVSYTDVDPKAAGSIKEIVDHYLHIKNALANDDGREAAVGARAMEGAISKLDKSLLTANQKNVYDELEEKLKEHAGHIAKNGDNVGHEREQFSLLSNKVYDLVKAFGSGRTLYHDHCPMYNDNQGAMWLSETKEVKNPYFGAKMPTCGTVEEVIK